MLNFQRELMSSMKDPTALTNSTTRSHSLDQGRESLRRQAWGTAFLHLSAADREEALDPEDLRLLAEAARLTGREADSTDILARAHQGFSSIGDFPRAARCAIWLGFSALLNSEFAQASGWVARARRLLEGRQECVEQGYLLLPTGLSSLFEGDIAGAHAAYVQAAVIGERF